MMQKLDKELVQALRERAETLRLLDSLEHLETGESITEKDRAVLKHDYEERLSAADASIERLRASIRDQLRSLKTDRERLLQQKSTLEVRHKVGELDTADYREAVAELNESERDLRRRQSELVRLHKAESDADIAALSSATHREQTGLAPRARLAMAGTGWSGKSWLSGHRLTLVAGSLVAAGVLVVAVLVVQAGVPGLPSISNPFQPGDDAPAETASTDPGPAAADSGGTALVGTDSGELPNVEMEFELPLIVRAAPRVGSLHVELAYEEAEVELISVQAGALPVGSLFQYAAESGRVTMGIVSVDGLEGDLAVASLMFRVYPDAERVGDASFVVENVAAHDAILLAPIATTGGPGRVDLVSLAVTPAAVDFY